MESGDNMTDSHELERRSVLAATAGTLAAGTLGFGTTSAAGASDHDDESLTIVHDLHLHGRLEDDTANIAEYYSLVQDQLDEHENAIFLGAGDEFSPSVTGSWFEGEHIVDALNLMEVDGVAVGNHENDFGEERMLELFDESEFPWLATNLSDGEGNPYPGTEQWITKDIGAISVGILGWTPPWWSPEGGESLDLVDSTQSAIDHLRDEEDVDFVVGASHLDGPSAKRELARNVDGLDAIVGDHLAQIEEEAIIEDDVVISVAGDEFDHLASVTLDSSGLVNRDLFALEEMELTEDEEMAELMNEYLDVLEAELSEPVARAGVDLDARFDSNYNEENEYENLVTEAMAEQTGADIAIQNAGGIRSNQIYEAGDITAEDILDTLPFPDPAIRVEVTGAELVAMLEDRVATIPDDNPTFGAQPQIGVHNIQYDWHGLEDHGLEEARAVQNVHVNGEPVEPDATYTASLSNIMASILADIRETDEDPAVFGEETDTIGSLMIDHAEELGYLEPKIHNRIHRFDEAQGTPVAVDTDGGHTTLTYPEPEHSTGIHSQTFYAVSRTGTRIEADTVRASDGEVHVGFRTDKLRSLVTGVEDPTVRVFGGFDPDAEGYNMIPEGESEAIDLPLAARFDYFVMRGQVDEESLAFDTSSGADTDGDDDGETDDTDEEDEGDANGDSTDDTADTVDDADDNGPGFGVAAAATGAAGTAYMLSRFGDDETEK